MQNNNIDINENLLFNFISMLEVSKIMGEVRSFPGVSGVTNLYRQGKLDEIELILSLGEKLEKRLMTLRDNYLAEVDIKAQINCIKKYFTINYENNDIIFIFHLAQSKEEFDKLLGLFHHSYNYDQLIRQFSRDLEENISFTDLKELIFGVE